jgi:hypothetical protein
MMGGWGSPFFSEIGKELYGLDFGDPTLGCQGRGRICRVEKIDASEGMIPHWVEAVGNFYEDPIGEIAFVGSLTPQGEKEGVASGEFLRVEKEVWNQTGVGELTRPVFSVQRWGRKIQLIGSEKKDIPASQDK